MEKYNVEEWLDILVGDVDLKRALAEVCDLEPDRAKLLQKLTAIADPAIEEVNARIWDSLRDRISGAFGERFFIKVDTAMPDGASSLNPVACRRLAGLLAERMQATAGGTICSG
jgi:hypothetical protein